MPKRGGKRFTKYRNPLSNINIDKIIKEKIDSLIQPRIDLVLQELRNLSHTVKENSIILPHSRSKPLITQEQTGIFARKISPRKFKILNIIIDQDAETVLNDVDYMTLLADETSFTQQQTDPLVNDCHSREQNSFEYSPNLTDNFDTSSPNYYNPNDDQLPFNDILPMINLNLNNTRETILVTEKETSEIEIIDEVITIE